MTTSPAQSESSFIKWFADTGIDDIPLVGGKNASLGEMDSPIVAPIFDERNPAVKKMIADVIVTCRARGRKIGICGQAPSDYAEFAQFLVEQGITSISLTPDTVLKTTKAIIETEQLLLKRANLSAVN